MPKPPKKKDYSKLVSDIFDDKANHLIDDVLSTQPESEKTTPVEKKLVEAVKPAEIEAGTPAPEEDAELSENDLAVGEDQFLNMLMDNLDSNEEDPELSKFLKEVSFEVTDLSGLPLDAPASPIVEETSAATPSLALPIEPAESSVLPVHRPDKTEERRAIPAEPLRDLSLPLVPISYPPSSGRIDEAPASPVEQMPGPAAEAATQPQNQVEPQVDAGAGSAVEPAAEAEPAMVSFRDALENLVQVEPGIPAEPVAEQLYNPFEQITAEPAGAPEPVLEEPLWAADEEAAHPAIFAEPLEVSPLEDRTPVSAPPQEEGSLGAAAAPEAVAESLTALPSSAAEAAEIIPAEAAVEAVTEIPVETVEEPQAVLVEARVEERPAQTDEAPFEVVEVQPVEAVIEESIAEQQPDQATVEAPLAAPLEAVMDETQVLPGPEIGDELLTLLTDAIEDTEPAQFAEPVEAVIEGMPQPQPVDAAIEEAQPLPAEEEAYLLSGAGEAEGDYLGQIVREIEADSRGADLMGEIFGFDRTTTVEAANLKRYLVFSIGVTEYAVPILNVSEVVRPLNVTPVPNLPDWVSGVSNLRGDIMSVVDLRAFLGQEYSEAEATNRMLVVHAQNEDITMGLIVDRVGGIFDLPEEQIRSPSAPIEDKISAYMRGVSDYREHLFVVIDLNRLLLSPEVQQFQ